jgi:hypothetical protein
MKKLYFLNEEEKNRILNLHENATKRQYLGEQQTERQRMINKVYCGLKNGVITDAGTYKDSKWDDYVKDWTVLPNEIETAKKSCPTAPKDTENIEQKMKALGAKISVDLSARLVKAGLNSVRQKVVGVIFCSVKNGVITADNEYKGKKWDDFVKDFTITNQEIETAKKACPKNNNSQQYKQQIITKTSDTTKQIQALLKLDPTGVMDSGLLQKINTKLNGGK